MMYGVHVETEQWQFSNDGRLPRGRGNWAFKVGGETLFFQGTYGQAKVQAIRAASERGLHVIAVLP